MFTDTYKTILETTQGLYKEKGSKFISFAIPVKSEEEAKQLVKTYKNKYFDARHHCFAYILGYDKSITRSNDDGEPSNTAGKPIMNQISALDLTNLIVIVVRYFGGTLLGVSGLINAYRSAAQDALTQVKIIEKTVNNVYQLSFKYDAMNDVMKILKDEEIEQYNQKFELNCELTISIRKSITEKLMAKLQLIQSLQIKLIHTI